MGLVIREVRVVYIHVLKRTLNETIAVNFILAIPQTVRSTHTFKPALITLNPLHQKINRMKYITFFDKYYVF